MGYVVINIHGILSSAVGGKPATLFNFTVLLEKRTVSQLVVQSNQLPSVSISGQDSQLINLQVSETLIGQTIQLIYHYTEKQTLTHFRVCQTNLECRFGHPCIRQEVWLWTTFCVKAEQIRDKWHYPHTRYTNTAVNISYWVQQRGEIISTCTARGCLVVWETRNRSCLGAKHNDLDE
jgi:hypothetical protein